MRPAWVEVDLDAIQHNVAAIARHLRGRGRGGRDPEIMAVVKANAYGHGAVPVALACLAAGATRLAVATVEEAIALRRAGIAAPIHILGTPPASQAALVVAHNVSCGVADRSLAEALSQAAVSQQKTAKVHIKVDTGMGRLGILPEQVVGFARELRRLPRLEIAGLYSHLATADEADKSFAYQQLSRFQEVAQSLEEAGIPVPFCHLANSAAILDMPEAALDGVRPGIILYGLYPSSAVDRGQVALQPALSLKARLNSLKTLPPHSGVSYGQLWYTRTAQRVGVVPLGYADGYSRLLSGQTEVLLGGRRVPAVGRICMDQFMVAIPDDLEASVGDEVVLIGRQGGESISADEVAEKLGTISYEVLSILSPRLPRVYVRDGRTIVERGLEAD
ncbi:MAG: alanine racemase [Firmicutes bacterium]|nr:alanine racemase [Bacillota bacterium]